MASRCCLVFSEGRYLDIRTAPRGLSPLSQCGLYPPNGALPPYFVSQRMHLVIIFGWVHGLCASGMSPPRHNTLQTRLCIGAQCPCRRTRDQRRHVTHSGASSRFPPAYQTEHVASDQRAD